MTDSKRLFELAQQVIPGGVNSPVRAFRGVGGEPRFIERGFGARIVDVEGREYIDYVGSWGPLILGHAHPVVLQQVITAAQKGFSFGASTPLEVKLAQQICEFMPAIEMVRLVSSGTEAVMSAVRLARGFTQRDKIIKFAACYHGHADYLLVETGSGGLTLGIPNSLGVPQSFAEHTLVARYNDLDSVAQLFKAHGSEIAAVIVEPIAGNMNCILPVPGFLQGLRDLCDQHDSVLIFDEVITGFRVALGGAQAYYGVTPDLTTLGKIVGGGFPLAAYGGKREIMSCVAPLGKVYQAGTLSGNPVAVSAGLATLSLICAPGFYDTLAARTLLLIKGLQDTAASADIPFHAVSVGSMFGLFFTNQTAIRTDDDVKRCNVARFKQFFHAMLEGGVYLAPSAFEVGFVSAAHTDADIAQTIAVAKHAFAQLHEVMA
jgi:glutamate-1-semialdehyde 2,1-aminomutase